MRKKGPIFNSRLLNETGRPLRPKSQRFICSRQKSIQTILCLAAKTGHILRHYYISSALTSEPYSNTKAVFVRQLPLLDGTMIYPNHHIGQLRLNLYGSRPAAHIYYQDLDTHLIEHGFNPMQSDPCVFLNNALNCTTTVGITTDDFLVSKPTEHLITYFRKILQEKYSLRDLGPPSKYIVW